MMRTLAATILVSDDEPQILDMLVGLLTRAGYCVLTATRPENAISICSNRETSIDLVISDFEMGGLNGLQMAQEIIAVRPGLEFIFFSGNPQALIDLSTQGFTCLQKPCDIAILLATIRDVLERSRQRLAGHRE